MRRPRIMKVVLRHYVVTANRPSLSLYAWRECGVSSLPLLRLSGDEGMCFALQMKTGARTLVVSFLSKESSAAQDSHLSALLLEWGLPGSSQRLG
jgi:hypothetical protein